MGPKNGLDTGIPFAPMCAGGGSPARKAGAPNPKDGKSGLVCILSFSISASLILFSLARRFWNQILTWVSVRFREEENSARSAMERYCLDRNFRSRAKSCCVVNGVLGLRLLLCFRSWHFIGNFGNSPGSGNKKKKGKINRGNKSNSCVGEKKKKLFYI